MSNNPFLKKPENKPKETNVWNINTNSNTLFKKNQQKFQPKEDKEEYRNSESSFMKYVTKKQEESKPEFDIQEECFPDLTNSRQPTKKINSNKIDYKSIVNKKVSNKINLNYNPNILTISKSNNSFINPYYKKDYLPLLNSLNAKFAKNSIYDISELINESREYNIAMGKIEPEFYYEIMKDRLISLKEQSNFIEDSETGTFSNEDSNSVSSSENAEDMDYYYKCY